MAFATTDVLDTGIITFHQTLAGLMSGWQEFVEIDTDPVSGAKRFNHIAPPRNPTTWDGISDITFDRADVASHTQTVTPDTWAGGWTVPESVEQSLETFIVTQAQAAALNFWDWLGLRAYTRVVAGFTDTVPDGAGSTCVAIGAAHKRRSAATQSNLGTDALSYAAVVDARKTIANWLNWEGNPMTLGMQGYALLVDNKNEAHARMICESPTTSLYTIAAGASSAANIPDQKNTLADGRTKVHAFNFSAVSGDDDDWFMLPLTGQGRPGVLHMWIKGGRPNIMYWKNPKNHAIEYSLTAYVKTFWAAPAYNVAFGSNVT